MNAATKQKKWIIVGVTIARMVTISPALGQEQPLILAAQGKVVKAEAAGVQVAAVQPNPIQVASVQATKHDSLTLAEIRAGAIRQFKIKVDTDQTTGALFAQVHGTAFNKCLRDSNLIITHRINQNKKFVGFDLRDKGDLFRNCQNKFKDRSCSSDVEDDLACVPLTKLKNSRIDLDGLAGSDLVIVHDNLEASDEDDKIVAEKTGVAFKSIQEQNFEALEAARLEEDKRQAAEKTEFNRLVGNVNHCRAGDIDIASDSLATINMLYPHLIDSSVNLAKYEKDIKIDGLSRMECEVRGKPFKGKCGKIALIKERSALFDEAEKLLGDDEESWVNQNNDVVASDKVVESRVVDLTKAIINRVISPDEGSDDENKEEDGNQLTEEHFDKAAEIAEQLERNVNLSAANKKKAATWKEDIRLLKLSYATRNGLSKSYGKIQSEQNRLIKQAQKLCGNGSSGMFGIYRTSNRNEKAQEAKAEACADVKNRLQAVSSIARQAQMTEQKNYQMAQMQQQRAYQMAIAQQQQEQMNWQREMQMMNMSSMGQFGVTPGMSPVMGAQMYNVGLNNPSLVPGTSSFGSPYSAGSNGGNLGSDWSVTGYFNPYNLK